MDFYDNIEDLGIEVGKSGSERSLKTEMLEYIDKMMGILNERDTVKVGDLEKMMWSKIKDDGKCELNVRISNKKVYFGRKNILKEVRVECDVDSVRKGIKVIRKVIEGKNNGEFIKVDGDYEVCYVTKKGEVGSFVDGIIGKVVRNEVVLNTSNSSDEFDNIFEG